MTAEIFLWLKKCGVKCGAIGNGRNSSVTVALALRQFPASFFSNPTFFKFFGKFFEKFLSLFSVICFDSLSFVPVTTKCLKKKSNEQMAKDTTKELN